MLRSMPAYRRHPWRHCLPHPPLAISTSALGNHPMSAVFSIVFTCPCPFPACIGIHGHQFSCEPSGGLYAGFSWLPKALQPLQGHPTFRGQPCKYYYSPTVPPALDPPSPLSLETCIFFMPYVFCFFLSGLATVPFSTIANLYFYPIAHGYT